MSALHTDYIRTTHGERSAKFILVNYGLDKRWEISGVNLADYVAKLSKSHVKPAQDLNGSNGFNYDESIGVYHVNMVYLGIILRLADILDFDRDRTPDSLYRSIHFTSSVSLQEWEKHRSVTGWTINPEMVRFTAYCEHPEYERAIRQFMDWIDVELSACYTLVKKFPKSIAAYQLDLPLVTNRERIGPKDNAYIYHDLEFSLSRDQIVKLLMTDQLYGSANLCIRELLQNAFDALRLRRSVIWRDSESTWGAGKVVFEHFIDENDYEIVRCTDNGVGMDVDIITKYLTSVGRSYYRSPEFEQERHSLQQAKADFEPIGQFGIGFMSCFMLGDRIKIRTRKEYGRSGGYGPNLLVEINGLGGIVTIKEIDENLPVGTSVEIQCGKFDGLLNYFNTQAQVVASIEDITIAPEFPITAECTIPENKKKIDIPNSIHALLTPQEQGGFEKIVTETFEFNKLDDLLEGSLRYSFLISDAAEARSGELSISNSEATLLPADFTKQNNGTVKRQYATWVTHKKQTSIPYGNTNRIAFDGIYVCGDARYNGKEHDDYRWRSYITHYGNMVDSGNTTFTLNVKGILKAPLTPARAPLNPYNRGLIPGWKKLSDYVSIGIARVYENLIAQRVGIMTPENYWRLFVYNRFDLRFLRMGEAWQYLMIPCVDADDNVSYLPLSELGPLTEVVPLVEDGAKRKYRGNSLFTQQGLACHMFDQELWHDQRAGGDYNANITNLITAFSTLSIVGNRYVLTPTSPNNTTQFVGSRITGNMSYDTQYAIPYQYELNDVLLLAHTNTTNINHPLAQLALASHGKQNPTPVETLSIEMLKLHRMPEEALIEAVNGEGEPGALTTRLGILYSMVNWDMCSPELKPPYKIHFPSRKIVELTTDLFIKWSKEEYTCS